MGGQVAKGVKLCGGDIDFGVRCLNPAEHPTCPHCGHRCQRIMPRHEGSAYKTGVCEQCEVGVSWHGFEDEENWT